MSPLGWVALEGSSPLSHHPTHCGHGEYPPWPSLFGNVCRLLGPPFSSVPAPPSSDERLEVFFACRGDGPSILVTLDLLVALKVNPKLRFVVPNHEGFEEFNGRSVVPFSFLVGVVSDVDGFLLVVDLVIPFVYLCAFSFLHHYQKYFPFL